MINSGRSRISHRGREPVKGAWTPRHRCFLAKMYVKTKELGPVGGGACARHAPLDLPMINVSSYLKACLFNYFKIIFSIDSNGENHFSFL